MQSHARAVVIGGGCVGVNILYALAKRGWRDVALLERTELTAGSTWHAAGLIPVYSFSYSFGRVIAKTIEIYESLEAETGQSIGWHKCGQLRVAHTRERMDEYLSYAGIAETQGVRAEILSPGQVKDLWPLMQYGADLRGGVYNPDDGHIAPADVTQAVAKGARNLGAQIHRNTEVQAVTQLANGEWRVQTNRGEIVCEHLITATGNFVHHTAKMLGLRLAATPVVHQYWITEPVPEVMARHEQGLPEMPVLRDESINGYVREEKQALMFGPYEHPQALELFAYDGVPEDFGADLLPEHMQAVEDNWQAALERVPALGEVGIKSNVRGPICTTPDNLPLVGPAWGKRNLWLAEGFSGGILMPGGLGHYLAEWIIEGEPGIDLSEVDCRRFGPYANKRWTAVKAKEAFGHNFGVHFPGYEWPAGRPLKMPPSYDRLTAERAVWGAVYGWEIPLWFAPPGTEPKDLWSYREFNSKPHVQAECQAIRERVGLIEMSPMAKFEVSGPGAHAWLEQLFANRVPATPGRISLCHLLTVRGGVRAEFTVTRLQDDVFFLVSTPRGERHDFDCLWRALPYNGSVTLRNVTLERGCWTVVGPKARDILQGLSDEDLSNETFRWLTGRTGALGLASDVRMLRVNYEGELGWELYHPICYNLHLFDEITRAGAEHGLSMAGYRAIESLRLDKSYRAMYRDLNIEHTALESGLDRFVRFDKDYVGREALEKQRQAGLTRRMVTLAVETVDADAFMNEGVYRGDELVGRVTSGAHSHTFGHCLSLAYLHVQHADVGTQLEIPLLGKRRKATVIADTPYDPQNERPRR